MAGFRCTDCIFSSFSFNEKAHKYQGACSRGYTLADPHVRRKPDMFFADRTSALVPVVDPYGREYLRTKNICDQFVRLPQVPSKDAGSGGEDAPADSASPAGQAR